MLRVIQETACFQCFSGFTLHNTLLSIISAHCPSSPKASYSLVIESYELLLQTLFNPLAAFILFIIFELKSGRPVACNHTRKTVHMVLLSHHTPLHIILAIDEINQP